MAERSLPPSLLHGRYHQSRQPSIKLSEYGANPTVEEHSWSQRPDVCCFQQDSLRSQFRPEVNSKMYFPAFRPHGLAHMHHLLPYTLPSARFEPMNSDKPHHRSNHHVTIVVFNFSKVDRKKRTSTLSMLRGFRHCLIIRITRCLNLV